MENVHVPTPNPFVTKFLRSSDAKRLVTQQANRAAAIYRSTVHKRTGRLAASTTVSVIMGGRNKDRWEAHLSATAPYAASHEFGTGRTNPSRALPAYNELWEAIKAMDWSK